jgi:FkbM family methyltransferase
MSRSSGRAGRLLWKYGTHYAKTIKRIPVLKDLAEGQYWKLVGIGGGPPIVKNTRRGETLYLGDYRALTKSVFGHKMFVDTRDVQITPHICLDGFWEMHIIKFILKIIKVGMNVVDIGANIGCHSIPIAASLGEKGKVYCFEANPHVFEILRQNFLINGLLEKSVLCNKAVSVRSERLEFRVSKFGLGGGTLGKIDEETQLFHDDEITTLKVEATSLDDYFDDETVKIGAMKIDAQGSEPLIFRGMKRFLRNNPEVKIICEYEPSGILSLGEGPKDFIEEIVNNGFRMHVIRSDSKTERISPSDLLSIRHCDLFLERG